MVHIVIVAAGRGSRFGSAMPKQFVALGDRPVVLHTLVRLREALPEAVFTVVLSDEYRDFFSRACSEAGADLPRLVSGGDTRAESVKNALGAIAASGIGDDDIVLIHDGARSVVPRDMVGRVVAPLLAGHEAVIPVIPVTDSLRITGSGSAVSSAFSSGQPFAGPSEVADRSRLVAVQTPQGFRAKTIIEAYSTAFSPSLTDDASVYQAFASKAPLLVEGSPLNIKITHPRDIDIAALYLNI